jgi:thiamine pyrophosphokinase
LLGIIFTGGDSPSSRTIRGELDGKEVFIVAADSGLVTAEEAGIRPDLIVGDMDSLDDASRLDAYPPQNVKRCDGVNKDYTDTEIALAEIADRGISEIWLIGGGGGRIDHLFALRSLFERDVYPCRWLTDSADIYIIEGESRKFSLKAAAMVSVFPLGSGEWEAQSEGLKWKLDGLKWPRGFFGLSNVAETGDFSIKAQKGRFMVILPLN